GDYQSNVAMGLAKQLGQAPRAVAEAIVDALSADPALDALLGEPLTIAGPGFINFRLSAGCLARSLTAMADAPNAGIEAVATPEVVVVDYSAPNVAKEMHVGHLRTTNIGDVLARVLGASGHIVVRQNHLGDWGTQFGMLIEHLFETYGDPLPAPLPPIDDLDALYKQAAARYKDDAAFAERARGRVVQLQAGYPQVLAAWRALLSESERHYEAVYALLGVLLTSDDIRGESFYNPFLADVCAELESQGLARIDDGALCAFPKGFNNRDGEPLGFIIRKSDGGYLYATTDLAAVRFRFADLDATRVIYVVDARQAQHFAMVFEIAREAGWLDEAHGASAEHVPYGIVLGDDNKPLKSRSGDTVKLIDLLHEAVARARHVIDEKSPDLPAEARVEVARAVGIGALRYADLVNHRIKNYVFDWDRMLAMDGNTAPYLQYAHARICSILRKADPADVAAHGPIDIAEPSERVLALQLVRFPEVVQAVADTLEPHLLCTYLFETAQAFTSFYEACSVLNAPTDTARRSRLAICGVTAQVLATGLGLLGIAAPIRL
ncbi:MAG: arginine--tRNA ligase, partial [Acidimicrobiia bacterium]